MRLPFAVAACLLFLGACSSDDSSARSPTTTEAVPTTASPTSRGTLPSSTTSSTPPVTAEEPTTTTEPLLELQGLGVEVVAEGLRQPVLVTSAPGDDDRLFVLERFGSIRVIANGTLLDEPFLDVSNQLRSNSIEQGLLGLAFHPDYQANGRFFVYFTEPSGNSRLAEFQVTDDPNVASLSSQEILFSIEQPAERHNAGMLLFGPDGHLWVAMGDGGDGGSNGQDTTNPLGAILRLTITAQPGDHGVPPGNPFVGAGIDDERVWAYGLRNPWRVWIDPATRLLYIGDVGQDRFEEIDVVSIDEPGGNFGWFETEGGACFRSGCELERYTAPVLTYGQEEGCSVTGGVVYRGALIPEFDGHYFYGDWCKGWVRSFRFANGRATDEFDWSDDFRPGQVSSFGVDQAGEMYLTNWDGQVLKIVAER